MSERTLRARRFLQAEHIVNNLKQSNSKPSAPTSRRIRKPRKRTPTHRSVAHSAHDSPSSLHYVNEAGHLRFVSFVLEAPEKIAISNSGEGTADTEINISDMFLQKYKQLLQSNLAGQDFYTNVSYDRGRETITLYNDDKEQGFELCERTDGLQEMSPETQEVMKDVEFEGLVKDYQLNNLYC